MWLIFARVASQPLGQSYKSSNANDAILKHMGKSKETLEDRVKIHSTKSMSKCNRAWNINCMILVISTWAVISINNEYSTYYLLTHWGWVTHICISKQSIIGSNNDLLPGWHQAIIWTNAGILLNGPLWTNFSEILIQVHSFSFKKMHLKMSSGK